MLGYGLEEQSSSRAVRHTIVTVLAHLAAWTVIALVFALQGYSTESIEGRTTPLAPIAVRELVRWGAWGVVSPLVFALVRRVARDGIGARAVAVLALAGPSAVVLRTAVAVAGGIVMNPRSGEAGYMAAFTRALTGRFALDLFIYTAIVTLSAAWVYHEQARQRLMHASRLEAQLSRARLEALEAHLHPHFLFNMLHSISSLLDTDVKVARRVLVRFGELLRMTLDARGTPEVPLSWEIAFVERYLEIQRIRFPNRLQWEQQIAAETRGALVPRLLLQPLVENAIRHAVERTDQPVTVTLRTARENGCLIATVDDTGPGLPNEKPGEGIGLSTTRARLVEAYGQGASLTVAGRSGGGLSVQVSIPFVDPVATRSVEGFT